MFSNEVAAPTQQIGSLIILEKISKEITVSCPANKKVLTEMFRPKYKQTFIYDLGVAYSLNM